MRRQIVAIGGGGFSMEEGPSLLDQFVLGLTGKPRPKVCFLPTASGDAWWYVQRFKQAFPPERAQAAVLSVFWRDATDLRATILEQDVVYVGGGNTANLLALWRVHGLDAILREAHEAGIVLAGVSAGAMCWFECGLTDSFGPKAPLRDGLGLIRGSFCPHYDGEADRRPGYHAEVGAGNLPAGLAADDGVALHYVDGKLHDALASAPGSSAYRVELCSGRVLETPLPTRVLE